jgi:hypothetical protein
MVSYCEYLCTHAELVCMLESYGFMCYVNVLESCVFMRG